MTSHGAQNEIDEIEKDPIIRDGQVQSPDDEKSEMPTTAKHPRFIGLGGEEERPVFASSAPPA